MGKCFTQANGPPLQQMYHVKSSPYAVPGNLDLNIADEEEFSPDKLRANLERLYTTVIVGLLGAVKHIARLRSWKETRRTTYFCVVSILDFGPNKDLESMEEY